MESRRFEKGPIENGIASLIIAGILLLHRFVSFLALSGPF